jgi:hypothetical protein
MVKSIRGRAHIRCNVFVTFYHCDKEPMPKITYRRVSLASWSQKNKSPSGVETWQQWAGSWKPRPLTQAPSRERKLKVGWVYKLPRPILSVLPPARPHPMNLLKEHHLPRVHISKPKGTFLIQPTAGSYYPILYKRLDNCESWYLHGCWSQ